MRAKTAARRRPSAQHAHSSTILSLASCVSGPTRTSLVPFLCIVSLKIRVDLDPDHRHPVLMCVCVEQNKMLQLRWSFVSLRSHQKVSHQKKKKKKKGVGARHS